MSRFKDARDLTNARSAANCVRKVRDFVESRRLIEPGSRVIAAVSGGPDSTALMVILSALSREMGFDLAVAHFDHKLRREAERERALVERHAKKLGVPCFLGAGDVPAEARRMKKGIEEAGRLLRLEFLEASARSWNAERVALGHTKDDQIETILHHMVRGAGWRGIQGIPAQRGIFIRPLLECSRAEIMSFLRRGGIRYAVDRSNFDTRLLRNKIRIELLPYLQRNFSPSIGETLLRLAANLTEGWETLERPLLKLVPPAGPSGEIRIPLARIAALTDFQIYLLVDLVLRDRFNLFQDVERTHYDSVKRLIRSGRSGRRIELPHDVEGLIEHTSFVLRRKREEETPREMLIAGIGRYLLPGWNLVASVGRVPPREKNPSLTGEAHFGSVRFPLTVRARRPGDRIVPFGMKGRKKLSDLFIDRKVPLSQRNRIPIFEDRHGIFWVPGVAADERTRIGARTRSIIFITLSAADTSPRRRGRKGPGGRRGGRKKILSSRSGEI
jgi:tRNA(Ile)-lysidine synthase